MVNSLEDIFDMIQRWWSSHIVKNDYYLLTRFLFPLSFTVIAVDIAEQFLNRSLARSTNVVDVLAAFGLSYIIVKVFSGVLGEIRHAGLVLVHDRHSYRKVLVFTLTAGLLVTLFLIITATTPLGVWLFRDLHRVSENVTDLTRTALLIMSAYPFFEALAWYHGGLLLQFHASGLVGSAALADIIAQMFVVAVLLYTPLLCHHPIALPILAAYGGVITRCTMLLTGFYRKVYPKLSKEQTAKLRVLKIVVFVAPLMFSLFIQRVSRPLINLIIARSSPSKDEAAQAVAVLTASYPLGHLPYGWLNTLKPVSPAFQQKRAEVERPLISGRKIAVFSTACLAVSAVVSFVVGWIPGVSVAILVNLVAIPHQLALLCVTPLRIFAFFCFTVGIRASLTGWLILHHQTKLLAPSGFIRLAAIISSLFILPLLGVTGADNGIGSLFLGFFTEMATVVVAAASFILYQRCKRRRIGGGRMERDDTDRSTQDIEMLTTTDVDTTEKEENEDLATSSRTSLEDITSENGVDAASEDVSIL